MEVKSENYNININVPTPNGALAQQRQYRHYLYVEYSTTQYNAVPLYATTVHESLGERERERGDAMDLRDGSSSEPVVLRTAHSSLTGLG